MKYFKTVSNGYILAVSTGYGNEEISEVEYNEIMSVIQNKPVRAEGVDYRLLEDLTWEECLVEIPEPEITETDKAEAYDILMGDDSIG